MPYRTIVKRVVPKKSFDQFASARHKKLFRETVLRITWLNKLSKDTVNLTGKEIEEIQVMKIELKKKEEIKLILNLIDKAIPYHIIFIVQYENEAYISTSTKHSHPINPNNAVIDWTFKTDWKPVNTFSYKLHLKQNLDSIFQTFFKELEDAPSEENVPFEEFVKRSRERDQLEKEVEALKREFQNTKQFNRRVELNLRLKGLQDDLKELT